jgi:hypothetical protein
MQIIAGISGDRMFFRGNPSGQDWSEWNELLHSGNSVNPLDFGLGSDNSNSAPLIGNFNTVQTSGMFRTAGGEAGTPQSSSIATVLNMRGGTTDRNNQMYIRADNSSNDVTAYIRGGLNIATPSYTDWVELFHSGNTNLTEFGGTQSGDYLGTGVIAGATEAEIFLPIFSPTAPTSITVTGSFLLVTRGGASVAGITSLTLQPQSSNRLARILISGLAGRTPNDAVTLVGESSTSKITVNF